MEIWCPDTDPEPKQVLPTIIGGGIPDVEQKRLCEWPDPDPKKVAPPAAASGASDRERAQLSRWLGSVAFWSASVGFLGFIPAYATFFSEGEWYLDAFLRLNLDDAVEARRRWGEMWMAGVGIHALTGICWTLAAFHQVISGATGPPGSRRKAFHRMVGYPAAALGVFVTTQAIALQLLKPFTLVGYTAILTNGALILFNLLVGIRYARLKRYAEHKVAMAWTCAWTGGPGGARVALYLFNISGDCPKQGVHGNTSYGTSTLNVFLVLVPVIIANLALGKSRSWLFMFNAVMVVLIVATDITSLVGATMAGTQCNK